DGTEQDIHQTGGIGDVVRGDVTDRTGEVAEPTVEGPVAPRIPHAVPSEQVHYPESSRRLTKTCLNLILGKPAHLVAKAEVPYRVDYLVSVVRRGVRRGEVASGIFGDDDEGLAWEILCTGRKGSLTKRLCEVPIADIGKVVDPVPVDV